MWYMTPDMRHVTNDMGHMICDMWHMVWGKHSLLKFKLSRSSEKLCFEDLEEIGDSVNQLFN